MLRLNRLATGFGEEKRYRSGGGHVLMKDVG